jgi:hypothetical protein
MCALICQPVEIRCGEGRVAVTCQIPPAEIIREDEYKVGFAAFCASPGQCCATHRDESKPEEFPSLKFSSWIVCTHFFLPEQGN